MTRTTDNNNNSDDEKKKDNNGKIRQDWQCQWSIVSRRVTTKSTATYIFSLLTIINNSIGGSGSESRVSKCTVQKSHRQSTERPPATIKEEESNSSIGSNGSI